MASKEQGRAAAQTVPRHRGGRAQVVPRDVQAFITLVRAFLELSHMVGNSKCLGE